MKKFTAQAVLLVLITAGAIYFFAPNTGNNFEVPFLPQGPKFSNIEINNSVIKVEIAETASKRKNGLSGKESLAENEGMLFIFEKAGKYTFWMKGLKFPLDFVWIKDDLIVDILENIPAPILDQPDESLPIYSSKVEANKVLEINAGMVQKLGIKVGDIVKLNN